MSTGASALNTTNRSEWTAVEVIRIGSIGPTYIVLTVRRPLGYSFLAGQYVTFLLTDDQGTFRRSYSIASHPSNPSEIEFCIQVERDGRAADILRKSVPGSTLTLGPAEGQFGLKSLKNPLVFIGGGSGVAPLVSILRGLLDSSSGGNKPGSQVYLLYGCPNAAAIPFLNEILKWRKEYPKRFFPFLAAETGHHPDVQTGNLMTLLTDLNGRIPKDAHYYLCGSPGMIQAMTERLVAQGVSNDSLFMEKY